MSEVKIVGRGMDTLVLNVCYADKQPFAKIVQIAMSLRDTTTDENELAMGYTVPQERLRRGRSETPVLRARYKSDRRRLQAPTVCCSHKGKHVEKDLFQKTSSSLPV